jgi:hypothetical protein
MRRSGPQPSGLFCALFALVAQLTFGAMVPDMELPLALNRAAIICHARSPDQGKQPPAHHHHVPLCAFCPLCTALAAPHPLLPPAAALPPAPVETLFHHPGLPPPSTAPPSIPFRLAQSRAPPVLV